MYVYILTGYHLVFKTLTDGSSFILSFLRVKGGGGANLLCSTPVFVNREKILIVLYKLVQKTFFIW